MGHSRQSFSHSITKPSSTLIVNAVSFFCGACFTLLVIFLYSLQNQKPVVKPLRESDIATSNSEYKFIDPLIGIKGFQNEVKYNDMKEQIQDYISRQNNVGLVTATVFFRDIQEPSGFTINPEELYTPASLYKVPVMMAYYKIAEMKPEILSDVIVYTGTKNTGLVQDIQARAQLVPGRSYSVEELIERMIRYSDNNSGDLLTEHLKNTNNLNAYADVFTKLGIELSSLSSYTDSVTTQKYSLFFRTLYNSTYLSREYSEHALRLLSESDFSEGIESGVPNKVTVAQKFGESKKVDEKGGFLEKELNNCGIVYYPKHPYLLCVLTKGSDDNVVYLERIIATISGMVYKNMVGRYPSP